MGAKNYPAFAGEYWRVIMETESMGGLVSVGSVVEQAIANAGVVIPDTRLVGCRIDNMPEGRMTVTAQACQSGLIVVAASGKVLSEEPLRAFKVWRWRLRPFDIRGGHLVQRGNILTDGRTRVSCVKCNKS